MDVHAPKYGVYVIHQNKIHSGKWSFKYCCFENCSVPFRRVSVLWKGAAFTLWKTYVYKQGSVSLKGCIYHYIPLLETIAS